MTDLLELRYIPISQAELFGNNAKLHNLDQIIASITKYGFKSACLATVVTAVDGFHV